MKMRKMKTVVKLGKMKLVLKSDSGGDFENNQGNGDGKDNVD